MTSESSHDKKECVGMSIDSHESMQESGRNGGRASYDTKNEMDALLAPRPIASRDLALESIDPNPFQARKHFLVKVIKQQ